MSVPSAVLSVRRTSIIITPSERLITPSNPRQTTLVNLSPEKPPPFNGSTVASQDTDNLTRFQRSLSASKKPGVTLARHKQSHIHRSCETLDAYIARPERPASSIR
jgi:hypothetical protein